MTSVISNHFLQPRRSQVIDKSAGTSQYILSFPATDEQSFYTHGRGNPHSEVAECGHPCYGLDAVHGIMGWSALDTSATAGTLSLASVCGETAVFW